MTSHFFDLSNKRVWVAGHKGMVGSALVKRLESENCIVLTTTREELDLCRQADVEQWMGANKPDVIFIAAAKVGGIHANDTYPVDFISQNLLIELNIINAAHQADVKKLMLLGSTCIYPKEAPQPIPEHSLLTGPLEPTNEWYAIAKIAGLKLCQAYRKQYGCDYITVMPSNLYGPGDNYHPENSHVIAGLIRRFHDAKIQKAEKVSMWGTGTPLREFLYVDDLADACIHLMKTWSDSVPVNIGSGKEISIRDLAEAVKNVVGFEGEITLDTSKPDGTMRKIADTSRLKDLGWQATTELLDGLPISYQDFLSRQA